MIILSCKNLNLLAYFVWKVTLERSLTRALNWSISLWLLTVWSNTSLQRSTSISFLRVFLPLLDFSCFSFWCFILLITSCTSLSYLNSSMCWLWLFFPGYLMLVRSLEMLRVRWSASMSSSRILIFSIFGRRPFLVGSWASACKSFSIRASTKFIGCWSSPSSSGYASKLYTVLLSFCWEMISRINSYIPFRLYFLSISRKWW